MKNKLWGGRFRKTTNPRFETFSSSYRWDRKLLPYDLAIDAAHVKALQRCGVLNGREAQKLGAAIRILLKKQKNGALKLRESAEDVHTAVQKELTRLSGPLADKLHTARSRNDLVAQSSRLYGKDHSDRILGLIGRLQRVMIEKAEEYHDTLVPGMTHLQNAQVLSVAHIFLAYAEMLDRARMRFQMARELCDVCVLGSGALAGVTFELDQRRLARELGLSRVTANSYDVSGDRDFALNILSSCAFLGTHLSRMAEDLMIGQTRGLNLFDIDESLCTGSSMMPQKKNADFVELMRGSTGILIGNLTGFLVTLKGLPTSYNRDLQWDKRFLFESVELCESLLELATDLFRTLKVNQKNAEKSVQDDSLYATDLADYLARKGVAFKAAHHQVGQIVSFAEEKRVSISKIGLDLLKKFAPAIGGDVYDLFDAEHSVRMKKTVGSTHPTEVAKQIKQWKQRLSH